MPPSHTFITVLALFSCSLSRVSVDANGYLYTPRPRIVYAYEVGPTCSGSGCPPAEFCPHCANTNEGVCGTSLSRSYETDSWIDINGNPMPWLSQEEYTEGSIIAVRSYLSSHLNGYMEIRACNKGSACTQSDFDGNELTFIEDTVFEGNHIPMPDDENYPERGMYAGGQNGGIQWFEFLYQLPLGIYGDEVMLQWKYITANSCLPPGYEDYFGRHPDIPDDYWISGLSECSTPFPDDGEKGPTWPEQFFNCAEIKINSLESTNAPSNTPTNSPTKSPVYDCDFINLFGVPSSFPNNVFETYDYIHVSENGPNLDRVTRYAVQWGSPNLFEFSFSLSVNPYYIDLRSCMTNNEISNSNAAFTLSECAINGIDGEYWITQSNGNVVWVEKNNGWAIVFSQDSSLDPEFCDTTENPTGSPTENPTSHPTKSPTESPTKSPSVLPTQSPTESPTKSPSVLPTQSPTGSPTESPTMLPTLSPTESPTESPTIIPTQSPTGSPTKYPTRSPTVSETQSPTGSPTKSSDGSPTPLSIIKSHALALSLTECVVHFNEVEDVELECIFASTEGVPAKAEILLGSCESNNGFNTEASSVITSDATVVARYNFASELNASKKNQGMTIKEFCVRSDVYATDGSTLVSIGSVKADVVAELTFSNTGGFSITNIAITDFNAEEFTTTFTRQANVYVELGACDGIAKESYRIGDTLEICITNDDSDARISKIKDVSVVDPNTLLVGSRGIPNTLTNIGPLPANSVTLGTFMISDFFDTLSDNGGISIIGTAEISFVERRILDNGRLLQEDKTMDKSFNVEVPLDHSGLSDIILHSSNSAIAVSSGILFLVAAIAIIVLA